MISCRGPEHGGHDKPSISVMRGNTVHYAFGPPSSSPLRMLCCIGGTAITTGNNQARCIVNASCLRLTNGH